MTTQTLAVKLELREGMCAYALDRPPEFNKLIADAPVIPGESPVDGADYVQIFSDRQSHLLDQISTVLPTLRKHSMLWISWPKKTSGVKTNLTMGFIVRIGREIGMEDVKICSIDSIWSAVKFVFKNFDPKADASSSAVFRSLDHLHG